MDLDQIISQCSHLKVCETRTSTDVYKELVFLSQETGQWDQVLSTVLGPAVKPAGTSPSPEHSKITEQYGGIYDDQVLYMKEFEQDMVVAMLWPWQDNSHTTLKMALITQ